MTQERELLRRMLELYTPTGQEEAVSHFLVERFRAAGLRAGCDEAGNLIGTVGNGRAEVVLLGHLDTVPGDIPVVEREGRLFGRGAVDAKGPMATFISAALRLAKSGDLNQLKLTVIGAVGEEGDSRGARHIVDLYRPQYLIIGEPSGWDSLVLGYKGSLRLTYSLARAARHSAGPDEAAPEVAVRFWQRLKAMTGEFNEDRRVFDQLSPSLRSIHSDTDGLMDRVTMDVGLRLPLDYGPGKLEPQLREWAEGASIEIAYGDPAVKGEKNTPLLRSFMAALREADARPRLKVKTGTSDMNVVAPAWGCPMLAYGPGDSSLDHTPDEHIDLAEYDRAISILETALKNLDKAETN